MLVLPTCSIAWWQGRVAFGEWRHRMLAKTCGIVGRVLLRGELSTRILPLAPSALVAPLT